MTSGRGVPAGDFQAAEQVLDLPDRLPGAGARSGPLDIDQGGPRGTQVPQGGGELVLPAGDGLAGAVAAARVVVDVAASGGAFGVRAGIRGGIDREPLPPPPRARLPRLGGLGGRDASKGLLQQAVVDPVVSRDPGTALFPVHELRQRPCEQPGEGLLIDLPGGQRVI